MKLIELKCKNCGSLLKVQEGKTKVECEFCHTSFAVEDTYSESYNKTKGMLDAQAKASEELLNKINTPGTKFVKAFIFIIAIGVIGAAIFGIIKGINIGINGDTHSFNMFFENRAGTQYKFFLDAVLDEINTNNKTNKKHAIYVKYNDIYTSDAKEITDIKHSLGDNKKYEVSYEYDNNGYINVAVIEDID